MEWIKRNIALLLISLFAIFFLIVAIVQGKKLRDMRLEEPDIGIQQSPGNSNPSDMAREAPDATYAAPAKAETPAKSAEEEFIVATIKTAEGSNLNIRDTPDLQGDVIGSITFGTKVKVFFKSNYDVIDGHSNYWYFIEADGVRGYAWGRYLE